MYKNLNDKQLATTAETNSEGGIAYKNFKNKTLAQKLAFSPIIIGKTASKKIAYVAAVTAVLIVANTSLEIRFADVQFSLTVALSVIAGALMGPASGFICCFAADGIGFIINSWGYLYMPWVGLASAVSALTSGLIINFLKFKFKGGFALQIALCCLSSFFLSTVFINSTGFYLYNYYSGFSTAVLDYVKSYFGGNVDYFAYLAYRLIFKGQIINCLVNYAFLFLAMPILFNLPIFKKDLY